MKKLFMYFLVIAMSCTSLLGNIEEATDNTEIETSKKIEQITEASEIDNQQEEGEITPKVLFFYVIIINQIIMNQSQEEYEEINKEELFNYLKNMTKY